MARTKREYGEGRTVRRELLLSPDEASLYDQAATVESEQRGRSVAAAEIMRRGATAEAKRVLRRAGATERE